MRRPAAIFALLLLSAAVSRVIAQEPVLVPKRYDPMPMPDENYTDLHKAAEKCDAGNAKSALGALRTAEKKAAIW